MADGPALALLLVLLAASVGLALVRRRAERTYQTYRRLENEETLRQVRGPARSQAASIGWRSQGWP